ncbi:DUF2169 domain-containing protein [Xanthobacter sp. V0B-10]|uniref:DUF2169 family type VI secretion system accessory protein n=1 Tax=Xanthobacter albus TaxID=3119929 RepID=UPI0037296273
MPVIIKPRTLGLLHKVERRRDGGRFIVTVLAAFDLEDSARIDGEQGLWTMAAAALPPGTPLDMGMPKPRAEVLIAGRVQAPDAGALLLEAQIGGLHKRLAVFGDRWWATQPGGGYAPTAPRAITDLLLSRARAFGGAGHPANKEGLGSGALDRVGRGEAVALPNIEDPDALIHSILDQPAPAAFGPVDLLDPARQALAGTYDAAWTRDLAPGLPDDIHPDFFMTAPRDQWLAAHLRGDEPYRLHNFSAGAPFIEGRLPGIAPRAFVGRGPAAWNEIALALDTVWLVAGARRGVLVWHGVMPVADIEGRDVTDVMIAYERMGAPPRSLAHYAQVRQVRCDPATAARFAFSEWQLAPARDPDETARRKAARMARAREQAALRAQAMAFLAGRAMDAAGVPQALRPAPMAAPEPMPLPTPEEIAEGDFDLGEVLDLLDAQTARAQAELEALQARGRPVLDAMRSLEAPGAGPAEVDALLDAMAPLTGEDVAAGLDEGLAGAGQAAPGAIEDIDIRGSLDAALGAAAHAADWRSRFVEGLKGGGDDESLLAEALARFLQRPEARPLAQARDRLREAAEQGLPPLPALPEVAAPAPRSPSVRSLLDELAADPQAPRERLDAARDRLCDAGGQIAAALPGLGIRDSADAVDALLAEIAASAPAGPAPDLQEAMARRNAGITEARSQVEEAEARLSAGVATMRRMAAKAAYPERPLPPRVARRFGDSVLEHVRAGLSLAGRDLAGVDLAGADLSGLDLSGAFLERANLANTRLRGANLARAALTQARLDHADLSDADLAGANLSGASGRNLRLDGARLSGAMMLETCLAGASARRAVLSGMRLISVDLTGADLEGARIEDGVLIRVTAAGARLAGATLRQCQVLESDFSGACLDGAFLDRCALLSLTAPGVSAVRADVRGSAFIGEARLAGLDLSEGLCNEASFHGADLTGASFRRAVCERAMFNAARLSGADFRLATLRSAMLDGADLTEADCAGAQMMEAQLHRATLARASFRRANLFGADLSDAVLDGADLTGANLANSPLALETIHG